MCLAINYFNKFGTHVFYIHVFSNKVLNITEGIEDLGGINRRLAACLAVTWIIVFLVLIKGISSLGKVSEPNNTTDVGHNLVNIQYRVFLK